MTALACPRCGAGSVLCSDCGALACSRCHYRGPLDADSDFADALTAGQIRWCRARLLRGLALAVQQGKLHEVLGELLPDDEGDQVADRLAAALRGNGWLP